MQKAKHLIPLFLLALLPIMMSSAHAEQSEACLGCHGDKEIIKKGGDRLYVDRDKFAGTSHAMIGCSSCHSSVTSRHPDDGIRPSRASCKECHGPVQEEYGKSLHASHAECSDCHNPHAAKNNIAASGQDMNTQCAKCHDTKSTITTHAKWLPQADLHIDALPCITCHTGSKNYYITMYVETRDKPHGEFRPATYQEITKLTGGKPVESLIDSNRDNQISLAELRKFNRAANRSNMRLWGMMKPEVMTHSFQILDNRWDCTFCHSSGPKAMQTSYLAFPDQTGRYAQLSVEKGAVLDLLYGTPDFYMMGSTRSTPLSIVGLLIIAGGLVMPIGHGTLRFLTRKNRKEH